MNYLKILLMLPAIIPSLDGCSSRTLHHGSRSIHFFRAIELSQNNASHASSVPAHSDDILKRVNPPQSTLAIAIVDGKQHFRDQLESNTDTTEAPRDFKNATNVEIRNNDIHYKMMSKIVSIECVEWFRSEFCLNGGRCFLYTILNHSLSSCECAEGYVGERCEAKSYEFIPRIHPRMVAANTIGGLFIFGLAAIDILFFLFLLFKIYNRN